MDSWKRKEGGNDQSFCCIRCPDCSFGKTSEQAKFDKRWVQNGADTIKTYKFKTEKSITRSDQWKQRNGKYALKIRHSSASCSTFINRSETIWQDKTYRRTSARAKREKPWRTNKNSKTTSRRRWFLRRRIRHFCLAESRSNRLKQQKCHHSVDE